MNQSIALTFPSGSLEAYLAAVHQLPVLTQAEEMALALEYRQKEDVSAARQLVLGNLRFVVHIARGFRGYGLAEGDLIQEGNIGLMKAVKHFDPTLGVRLISFAVRWIKAEIFDFILKNWRIVKIATTKAQRKLFFNLRKYKKQLGWLSNDEQASIAKELGVSVNEVKEMETKLSGQDIAFENNPENDEDKTALVPAYFLENTEANPAFLLEETEGEYAAREGFYRAFAALDLRSKTILQRRWLQSPKATLQTLAEELGLSLERVRQLESSAVKRLKQACLIPTS